MSAQGVSTQGVSAQGVGAVYAQGVFTQGVSAQGGICPGGVCLGVSAQRDVCRGGRGCVCLGRCLPSGHLSRGVSAQEGFVCLGMSAPGMPIPGVCFW